MPLDAQGRLAPRAAGAGCGGRAPDRRRAGRWPAVEQADDHAPAERFRFVDGAGEIGVISSVTQPFCGTCNRLRLTADGAIRNCLFSDDELDVRRALRTGEPDEAIERQLRRAVWGKRPGHGIDEPGFLRPARSMSMIGG